MLVVTAGEAAVGIEANGMELIPEAMEDDEEEDDP